jgi:hypothetical protein
MQMTWRLLGQEPVEVPGGRVRIVDSSNFHAASTIAAALVELDPGAMRELHWHPTNDEWPAAAAAAEEVRGPPVPASECRRLAGTRGGSHRLPT